MGKSPVRTLGNSGWVITDEGGDAKHNPFLFAKQHVPVAVTGTPTETTLFSTTIPGGTLGANGVLKVTPLWTITQLNNIKALYVKFGSASIISLYGYTTTITSVHAQAVVRNRNSQGSQICFTPGKLPSYDATSGANLTSAVNTSVDQLLQCTGQLATPTVTKSVSGITRSGQIATATSTAHGYANGQSVLIAGANQAEYNGTFVISNVTANTFDYTVTGTPATPATGTITAALWDIITLESVLVEVISAP